MYFPSTSTWPNQTKRLVIGRFNFVHLLTDDKQHKPDTVLMGRLGIPEYKWSEMTTWKKLWDYCYDNRDKCKWRGGLQVGVVSKGRNSDTNPQQHLHFGELLIPNKPISSNLLINLLWEFTGTLEFNGGTYQRYGYYEDVNDTRKPVTTAVQNRVNPTYPGYMTLDSVSTGGGIKKVN